MDHCCTLIGLTRLDADSENTTFIGLTFLGHTCQGKKETKLELIWDEIDEATGANIKYSKRTTRTADGRIEVERAVLRETIYIDGLVDVLSFERGVGKPGYVVEDIEIEDGSLIIGFNNHNMIAFSMDRVKFWVPKSITTSDSSEVKAAQELARRELLAQRSRANLEKARAVKASKKTN